MLFSVLAVALLAPGVQVDAPALHAEAHLRTWQPLVGAELQRVDVRESRGRALVRFAQTYRGWPVVDRSVVVTVRAGRVTRVHGDAVPIRRFRAATIDAARARRLAAKAILGDARAPVGEARAVVLALGDLGTAGFEVDVVKKPLSEHYVVRVDAHEGRVVGAMNQVRR